MESLLARLINVFQGVDSTFSIILAGSIVLFLGGEIAWWYGVKAVRGLSEEEDRLKFVWSLVPALVLVVLLFVHGPRVRKIAEHAKPRPEVRPAAVEAVKPPLRNGGA